MKHLLKITLFLICFSNLNIFSQKKAIKGYKIEGDYVVFTFDKRDYTEATNEHTKEKLDFDDFDIKNVVVSGNFNSWSRDSWKMTKVSKNIYELRKRITDFKDDFDWEFKFVINNRIWAEPSENISNITPARDGFFNYYTYNLKMYSAYPSKNGNAKFRLKGYENAKKVIVTGSFNKWNEQLFEMEKTDSGWELTLQLNPDKYEYRFIVDGAWIEDPINPMKISNEFGEYNSVIDISVKVKFFLYGYEDAKEVILAGSFNDWSEHSLKMNRVKNGWTYSTKLPSGKHHYKFIVDGNWKVDPSNPVKEFDGHGNINSVKMVK
ncbi:glycogen-binding domain-containing protein [uncultured Tenacibaculum sp.]|uniref:glycogen-binding domain-containing protein n=1 Tax=uncultured Tenacibaculum sp. TaxID=174713 RepID=UPI00261E2E4A|nr:glycogen-binding domain-containing protein [uncultured Tenacibaculum sp.]